MVADQAVPESAEVEQLVPVGTIPGQSGDVIGKYDPHIAQRDPADQFGEADASLRRPGGVAQVAVDDVDRRLRPTAGDRPLPEVILESQTFLMADHLLR